MSVTEDGAFLTETFQAMVLEFATLYDKKAEYRKIVSGINQKQKTLQKQIEEIMLKHEVDRLDTGDGTVTLATRKKVSPINKETIKETLQTYEGFSSVEDKESFLTDMVDYLYSQRKSEEVVSLKRTKKRAKKE